MHYPNYAKEAKIKNKALPEFQDHLDFYFSQRLGSSDFLQVQQLLKGDNALISSSMYSSMRDQASKSLVAMVPSGEDWGFFVLQEGQQAPQWILINSKGEINTDVPSISTRLASLLPGKDSIMVGDGIQSENLQELIQAVEAQKEKLLPLKKQRALSIFKKLIRSYAKKESESPAREAILALWTTALKEETYTKIDIGLLAEQLIQEVFDPILIKLKANKPEQLWHLQKLLPILKKEPISTQLLSALYDGRKDALPFAKQLRSCILGIS